MGSTLTGNTVASTYTGLLKTGDTGALTTTLKTISDGSGNDSALQVSTTAVNTTGDLSVATNKLTVASATGNTAVLGNFAINTNKFSVLAASGNTTVAGTMSITGAVSLNTDLTTNGRIVLNGNYGINQNVSGASNLFVAPTTFNGLVTFTGGMQFQSAVNMTSTLTVAGTTTLNGNVILGDAAGDTITVTGTPTFAQATTFNGSVVCNGNISLGSDASDLLTVNAVSAFNGNASFNGNTTIGSDASDTLTVNAAFNPATVTYDPAADSVLIQDASDSNKIKKATPPQWVDITLEGSSDNASHKFLTIYENAITDDGYRAFPFNWGVNGVYFVWETDFIPTKYQIFYKSADVTNWNVYSEFGIKLQYSSSSSGPWTDIGSGHDIRTNGITYKKFSGSISTGISTGPVYFRMLSYNNGSTSNNYYLNGFRMRISNL